MDLTPTRTVTTPVDDKAWLDSTHGLDTTRTITLDVAGGTFDAVMDADGLIPSGVAVVEGANGLFHKADDTAAAEEKADGHLVESVRTRGGATVGAALLWHGVVVQAQVPGGFVDLNRADHVLYV